MEQSNLKTADNLPARSPGKTRNLISRVVRWSWWLPALYLLALACAETLTSWVNPWTGQALHGLILVLALTSASHSGGGRQQRFLQALALPSLIRLLSLSLQLNHYPLILRHLAVGIPLFLATFLFMRASRLKWNMVGITRRGWSWQVLVGVSGIGLGFLEYIILRPDPPVAEHHWSIILALAFTLLVFTGLLEELIFRGLLQYSALPQLGRLSLLFVPAVYAILHIGYRSTLGVLFIFLVSLFFSWFVQHTGSILGVSLSHGLASIGLLLIFPFLLGGSNNPITSPPGSLSTLETAPRFTPLISILIPGVSEAAADPTPTASPSPSPSITPTAGGTDQRMDATVSGQDCLPPTGWVIYFIQPGDTLQALSLRLNVSVKELKKANCLKRADRIYAGQALVVPYLAGYIGGPPPSQPTATQALSPEATAASPTSSLPETEVPIPATEGLPPDGSTETPQAPPPTEQSDPAPSQPETGNRTPGKANPPATPPGKSSPTGRGNSSSKSENAPGQVKNRSGIP